MKVSNYYINSLISIKENLNLLLPSTLGLISIITVLILAGILVFYQFLSLELNNGFFNSQSMQFVALCVTIISLNLILSFLNTSIISMTRKIFKKDKLRFIDALNIDKIYFIKLFLVYIILSIFLIFFFVISTILIAHTNIGFGIQILGMSIILIPFNLVGQSIIIGQNSTLVAIKESINILWNNKKNYMFVSIFNIIIIAGIVSIFRFIGSFSLLIGLALIFIFSFPYFNLVFTHLYYDFKS